MERGRWRGGMVGLLLVQALSDYYRLERKPPVTAGLIAANSLIYLRPKFLGRILPTLNQVWFNPHLILKHKDLKRFILSAFYHIGEPHLVYNMLSLLWKGTQLEGAMGSLEYASMVAALLGMSHGISLLLAKGLLLFDYENAYYNEYSVGFSGVLFAMKVVLYSQSDNYAYVQGLVVPARYAVWAELILVQMLVPGVSFLGHLGGVLAGLLYVYLKASHSGTNPLIKMVWGLVGWPLTFVRCIFGGFRGGGGGRIERGNGIWRCEVCTYDNGGWLSACEMCGSSRHDSVWPSSASPPTRSNDDTQIIPLEQLRERRLRRFGQFA